ncbi:hypothetical protein PR048_033018 [Dryococelus australis]|uniref:Uncharacterized protein n=1 Tax=Dryococelus australis TaxID=614101 RepID=A0ABQ9G3W0_9NEOP|nr:hypothetical protein PR048_033018 [Dryococelus australis]
MPACRQIVADIGIMFDHMSKRDKHMVETEEQNADELTMANVGGVFLVLVVGCFAAFLFAILEMLWNCRKIAVEEKTRAMISPCDDMLSDARITLRNTSPYYWPWGTPAHYM